MEIKAWLYLMPRPRKSTASHLTFILHIKPVNVSPYFRRRVECKTMSRDGSRETAALGVQ